MCRPKNSRDIKKRKRKVILTGTQERELIQDYMNGVGSSEIYKKYGISKSALSFLKKRRNIKSKINYNNIILWKNINNFNKVKNISGIYVIYFKWKYNLNNKDKYKLINDIKLYIGSSVAIGKRFQSHLNELKNNKHFNQNLQNIYNSNEYSIHYAIIEECDESLIMQKEREYMDMWDPRCLLNTWKAVSENKMRPWLEKAIKLKTYAAGFVWNKNIFYNGSPCKETDTYHKTGYGRVRVSVNGECKHLIKHRIAYWEKYGEYPELVRHMCNNSKCYNADHLKKGNHKDNMLDRRGNFAEEFEKVWLKYKGNLYNISKYYEKQKRWVSNQNWNGYKVSYSVYDWEKKLDLKNKYKKICKKRLSKLRKQQVKNNLIGKFS